MIKKVISGGQTGVDIAALRAAKAVGLETGGWMPKGWRTEAGPRPEYAEMYGIQETSSPVYPVRTRWNVRDSHITLIIGTNLYSSGLSITKAFCRSLDRDYREYLWEEHNPANIAALWILDCSRILKSYNHDLVLNVAGNRYPELEEPVEHWLTGIFLRVMEAEKEGVKQ